MRLAVAAAAFLAVTALVTGCGTADFDSGASFPEAERAFRAAGLQVCSATTPEVRAPDATAERVYDLQRRCDEDDGDGVLVVVTEYATEGDRDAALGRYGAQARPVGVVWTLGRLTISASGDRDGGAVDDLTRALDEAGAE
jgi:hypothetical protein